MTVHASVMDGPIKTQEIGFLSEYVSSSKELKDMVNVFHKYKICQGCASPDSVRNSETTFAFRDNFGILWHNKCSLIMDLKAEKQSRYCAACKNAKITLVNKSVRLQNQTNFQQIMIRLSPNSKKKVALLS